MIQSFIGTVKHFIADRKLDVARISQLHSSFRHPNLGIESEPTVFDPDFVTDRYDIPPAAVFVRIYGEFIQPLRTADFVQVLVSFLLQFLLCCRQITVIHIDIEQHELVAHFRLTGQ